MPHLVRHTLLLAAAGAAFLIGLLLPAPVRADERQDLHVAYTKFMALRSFRVTMTDLSTGKTGMTLEYQAPDRYRMTVPGQPPQLIIGDTMILTMNGQTMRMPMPKGTLPRVRNEDALREIERGSVVSFEGLGTVGGQPAKIYRHSTQVNGKPAQTLVWVGVASGLPLQVETRGAKGGKDVRLAYSDFNSPKIRIDAPK